MGRSSSISEITIPLDDIFSSDLTFPSRSGGAAVKRYTHTDTNTNGRGDSTIRPHDRRAGRLSRRSDRGLRKGGGLVPAFTAGQCLYCGVCCALLLFVLALTVPQKLMRAGTSWGAVERGRGRGGGAKEIPQVPQFVPKGLLTRFKEKGMIDVLRSKPRLGVRPPRLALVLGFMEKDPSSLMLLTIAKGLQQLGYSLKIFSINDGEIRSLWEHIGCKISILSSENITHVDWSIFEGIILNSLEAKIVISSLKEEPFSSLPLIWIIQEDALAKRLQVYTESGWTHLISEWKSAFSRVDAVVFPDFSLPMLHNSLDIGNFFVIPGSPADVWAAETYFRSHSRDRLRLENGFLKDDLLIVLTGSAFFFDEQPWDFEAAMFIFGPSLTQLANMEVLERKIKFLVLCGNSTDDNNSAFKEVEEHLKLPHGSIRHYGFDRDVNEVLLLSDVVLQISLRDEQKFPSLLVRAMSFGIPIVVPDLPIMKKYIVDKVSGMMYNADDTETLITVFSQLICDAKLCELADSISKSAKLLSKSMFALQCVTDYTKLLENVVVFPSDTILPLSSSQLQQQNWEWSLFEKEIQVMNTENHFQTVKVDDYSMNDADIVKSIESEFANKQTTVNASLNSGDNFDEEIPTELDWADIVELEISEEVERREVQELEERIEKTSGSWEYIYNAARKSEKKKFEVSERDEGELERIGRPLCIYEIYNGIGAWPFLHHGTIYRGISLSKMVRRPKSDDVDAVERLPLLETKRYVDLLCELGGMFSIANRVDSIHKIPWIGFQSWRAAGRNVALTEVSEKVLEETIVADNKGDVIYFWAKMESEITAHTDNNNVGFWSLCDILNDGKCSYAFEESFRRMYGLPGNMALLPPMPENGDYWSALHSWVMPTPSFLEFIMFSRMFVDSLHKLNNSSISNSCLLGSSKLEIKHCYCRVLEYLVNVWAYHSARKMVYLNPRSGELKEQHPVELRKGQMWVKYFNFSLLKAMDEDLAEEADDGLHTTYGWLWPLTGEVHWQGILDREREERYRKKMDKQKKTAERLIQRQKHGYKQKALGG